MSGSNEPSGSYLELGDAEDQKESEAQALLKKIDRALRLCWASSGDGLIEKILHQPVIGCSWVQRRSVLLNNPEHLKLIYAITAFRRGAINVAEKLLHSFVLYSFSYSLAHQDKDIDLATLTGLWESKSSRGATNLVHSLDGLDHALVQFILLSPLLWGLFKSTWVNTLLSKPSVAFLKRLSKSLQYTPHYGWDTLGWLNPLNQRGRSFRKADLLLSWNKVLYEWQGEVNAESLTQQLVHIAKTGKGRTQIEAMHTLKLIAHGVSIYQTELESVLTVKTLALQTLLDLRHMPAKASVGQRLRNIPSRVYARYLLWELGAYEAIPYTTLPITAFKALKLYGLFKFYRALYDAMVNAAQCPEQPGFTFGKGFEPWAKLKTLECFYAQVNLFRLNGLTETEPVRDFVKTFPDYDLTHNPPMTNLSLSDKFLTGNETLEILDGLQKQGVSLVRLNLTDNSITSVPHNLFQGLGKLQSLDLNSNGFSSLPAKMLSGLTALQSLDLSFNQFSSLPAEAFRSLTALQSLYLSENQLNDSAAIAITNIRSISLQEVDLSSNEFSTQGVETIEPLLFCMNISLSSAKSIQGRIDFRDNPKVNASTLKRYKQTTRAHLLAQKCEESRCNPVDQPAKSQSCGW